MLGACSAPKDRQLRMRDSVYDVSASVAQNEHYRASWRGANNKMSGEQLHVETYGGRDSKIRNVPGRSEIRISCASPIAGEYELCSLSKTGMQQWWDSSVAALWQGYDWLSRMQ